ncbi:hypothetical protein ABPG72_019986 [Tetrahymena utriculariae]
MNKIDNKKTDSNQQRSNYHQQQNVKSRQGSSSVNKRRRQISSIFTNSSTNKKSRSSYETISNSLKSRNQSSLKKNRSNSRQRSSKFLKPVKGRKPTPIPPKKKQLGQQPCKFWMVGKCNKFEHCKFRHFQMSQIMFKQNKLKNTPEAINNEQHNNQKILVKIEQTSLMTLEEIKHVAINGQYDISKAIMISYKNKKALNKMKNQLNKNHRDPFLNNNQKNVREEQILNELLKNTQIDNKNKNAIMIKEKRERIKKEQNEKIQKPKISIKREKEEKQVQNQKSNNQQQQDNQSLIIESDESSNDEIDMTQYQQDQKSKNPNQQNTTQQQSLNNQQLLLQNLQLQQNQPIPKTHLTNPSQSQDLKTQNYGLNNPSQFPHTLVSPLQYIQEKDNLNNDINQNNQKQMKKLFGNEVQQDLKWSQNIKSLYQQWKQARDGKNQSNIYPSSDEPSQQSHNSKDINEIEDTLIDSQNQTLYDWKKIYQSKAYRNDSLQNFISYQHPKLNTINRDKVFNIALESINNEAFINDVQKFNQDSLNLKNNGKIQEILNIFYNKQLFDKSLESYNEDELAKHFYNSYQNPSESHIYKMAATINRYIKNLLEEILRNQIKNQQNQKISFAKEQYEANQEAIIYILREIILHNNTDPHQLEYITNQGLMNNTQYQNNTQQQQKIQKLTPNNNETISEESDKSINNTPQINNEKNYFVNQNPHNTIVLTQTSISQAHSQGSSDNIQNTQNNTKSSIQLGQIIKGQPQSPKFTKPYKLQSPNQFQIFKQYRDGNSGSNIAPSSPGVETCVTTQNDKNNNDKIEINQQVEEKVAIEIKSQNQEIHQYQDDSSSDSEDNRVTQKKITRNSKLKLFGRFIAFEGFIYPLGGYLDKTLKEYLIKCSKGEEKVIQKKMGSLAQKRQMARFRDKRGSYSSEPMAPKAQLIQIIEIEKNKVSILNQNFSDSKFKSQNIRTNSKFESRTIFN